MSRESELRALYPFLHGQANDGEKVDAALVISIEEKSRQSRRANELFFSEQSDLLIAAAKSIAFSYQRGGRLLSMGNGGSSCDAAHVAVEFAHPVTAGRPALSAISLVSDVAFLSAVANDVGFEHVFVRQLLALGRKGDVLLGFSTSGNSKNLLAAFSKAREMGISTIGFAGGDGGAMRSSGLVDQCLVAPSDSIHRVQECHVAAYHVLWDLVHTLLADERGAAQTKAGSP